ncbi:MAG TPA: plastocyanin/azurin family copper-binding protein [Candidatus Thermoplasmatota archaeon]|nr:plastocyanin/azurin family copper-binding protein [Candidatus Thermoplasmatota archaeon]
MRRQTLPLLCLAAILLAAPLALGQPHSHGPGEEDHHHGEAVTSESPMLSKGEAWQSPFFAPGRIEYHCHPHPGMKGTVLVSEKDPAAKDRVEVRIKDFAFEPQVIVVKPGGVVNWTNEGDQAHNVVLGSFKGGEPYTPSVATQQETPGPGLLAAVLALAGLALVAQRLSGAGRR